MQCNDSEAYSACSATDPDPIRLRCASTPASRASRLPQDRRNEACQAAVDADVQMTRGRESPRRCLLPDLPRIEIPESEEAGLILIIRQTPTLPIIIGY